MRRSGHRVQNTPSPRLFLWSSLCAAFSCFSGVILTSLFFGQLVCCCVGLFFYVAAWCLVFPLSAWGRACLDLFCPDPCFVEYFPFACAVVFPPWRHPATVVTPVQTQVMDLNDFTPCFTHCDGPSGDFCPSPVNL